ncbi:MAG: toprim domain-containing protein [Bacteroidota bacterium]
MNIQRAKQIPLCGFLKSLGYLPTRERPQDAWFLSPMRQEKIASFKVNKRLNLWYDFGMGQGGSIIELGKLYLNTQRVSEVLGWIATIQGCSMLRTTCVPLIPPTYQPKVLEIIADSVQTPSHKTLLAYASQRGISKEICQEVFQQVHFINHELKKEFYALGIQNIEGGWELRNQAFKGSTSPKAVTHINRNSRELVAFEGMFDYASWVQIMNDQGRDIYEDVLILNSTAQCQKGIALVQQAKYEEVNTYFDNDAAGELATKNFSYAFGGKHFPHNRRYPTYKDLNAYLIGSSSKRFLC